MVDLFKFISGMLGENIFCYFISPYEKTDYVVPFYPPSSEPLYFVAYTCLCIYLIFLANNEILEERLPQ